MTNRKCAQRYRWLRKHFTSLTVHTQWDETLGFSAVTRLEPNREHPSKTHGPSLNKAIDAAMRKYPL